MHFQRVAGGPSAEGRPCEPTPPDFIKESEHPIGVLAREADKAIPPGLLLGIVRVRAGHPEFSPSPLHPHPFQRQPYRFVADLAVYDTEFRACICEKLKRPGAPFLPEVARALVGEFL